MLDEVDNIRFKTDSDTVQKMLNTFHGNKTNSRIRTPNGGFILPLFNGFFSYFKACQKKNMIDGGILQKEFHARGILHIYQALVAQKAGSRLIWSALRADEKQRFEKDVNKELLALGVEIAPQLKLGAKLNLLKQTVQEKDDNTKDYSEFFIDMNKYFKKQSTEYSSI